MTIPLFAPAHPRTHPLTPRQRSLAEVAVRELVLLSPPLRNAVNSPITVPLTNMAELSPEADRYSFSFDGNA